MQTEDPTKKQTMVNWVVGILGMWAGFASIAALVAAMMSPEWALIKEPIMLEEREIIEAPKVGVPSEYYDERQFDRNLNLRPVVTTVSFKLGLWIACPNINTSGLHMRIVRPPCTRIPYLQNRISHQELHLPAPAPLAQTVVARMRVSTPFLVAACILLTTGSILALISRCCYSQAAIFAALLFSLGGLSIGVAVVWFISVISEDFGSTPGRNTSWVSMYGYWYGWSLAVAGAAGVGAMLAALLTVHSHVSKHITHFSYVCEEALQRPLLRCRSEGCLGGRSCTSDTLRTYLTNDSRRLCGRPCTHGQLLDRSPSIVDLTRSTTEVRQDSNPNPSLSESTSNEDNLNAIQQTQPVQHHQRSCIHSPVHHEQFHQKVQYHYQHHNPKHPKGASDSKHSSSDTSENSKPMSRSMSESPKTLTNITNITTNNVSTPTAGSHSSTLTHSSSNHGSHSLKMQSQAVVVPPLQYQTLQHRSTHATQNQPHYVHTLQHPHKNQSDHHQQPPSKRPILIRQSSVPSSRPSVIPISCPPPPTLLNHPPPPASGASTLVRQSSSEPPRLPELNTFTSDYSKTLPLKEIRQMAVFNRNSNNHSATLSRPASKLSSEV